MSNSDADLFQAWRDERDAEAFKALTLRYGSLVYAAGLRILSNAHEAEEVAQESFISLATAAQAPSGALAAWLHRVATNRALDRLRTARNRQRREQAYAGSRPAQAPAAEWNDILAYVDEAINSLPEKYRVPLVLHFYENHSGAAIAAGLGITRQAANYRIRGGVERVRHSLRKRGIPVASAALTALLGENLATAAPVPASLSVTLGQLAVAGVASPAAGLAASAAALGGAFIMYKILIAGAIVAVALIGAWFAIDKTFPQATPAPSSYVSRNGAPVTDEQPGSAPRQAASPQVAAPAPGATGDITGRIYDAVTGRGIAGAKPKINPANDSAKPVVADSVSDESGRYTIASLAPGMYSLSPPEDIEKYPLPLDLPRTITVAANSVVREVDFALDPGVVVEGKVLSKEGAPVKSAAVHAQAGRDSQTTKSTTTDNDGRFFFCLPVVHGCMDLQAGKDKAYSPKQRVTLRPEGVRDLVLTLSTTATAFISGEVVDTRQQPVPHATVGLIPDNARLGEDKRVPIVEADDEGRFTIAGIMPGLFRMYVTAPHGNIQLEKTTQIALAEGEVRKNVRVVLEDYDDISGRVVDPSGNGIEHANVMLSLPMESGRERLIHLGSAQSDQDGRFSLIVFEKRQYGMHAYHQNYSFLQDLKGLRVNAGDTDVEVVLHPKGVVQGRVVSDATGQPITQFNLYMWPHVLENYGEWLLPYLNLVSRSYDPEGRFKISPVPTDATLVAMAPGFTCAPKTVKVPPGETMDIEFRMSPSALIRGWVVDAAGAAVANAKIFLGSVSGVADISRAVAHTDLSGAFKLDSVMPGAKFLTAVHPAYAPAVAYIEDGMTITMSAGGVVKGTVTVNGKPVSDAVVTIGGIPGRSSHTETTQLDGGYQLFDVPPGDCLISATLPQGAKEQREIHIASGRTEVEDFDFQLGGSTLQGRILCPGTMPERASISLRVTGDAGETSYELAGGSDGTYKIENLVPGTAVLTALACPQEGTTLKCIATLEIPGRGTVNHDIDFGAMGSLTGTVLGVTPERPAFVTLLKGNVDLSGLETAEQIQAYLPQAEPLIASQVKCDGTGLYEVVGVPYGVYTVVAITVSQADQEDIGQWHWTASQLTLDESHQQATLDFDFR
jgi:RNA polymerase sigma factor (sigma-70 family)